MTYYIDNQNKSSTSDGQTWETAYKTILGKTFKSGDVIYMRRNKEINNINVSFKIKKQKKKFQEFNLVNL